MGITIWLIGCLLCAGWFFLQMKLMSWADSKGTLTSKVVSKLSLYLLSASITILLFTFVGAIVALLVNAMFGV